LFSSVFVIAFFSFCALSAFHYPIEYDEALDATATKNLILGTGFSTSYTELRPFDAAITTGPSLLLPAGVLMAFFGNVYWVPGLTNAIITGLLILSMCVVVHHRGFSQTTASQPVSFLSFCLVLLLALQTAFGVLGFNRVGLGESGAFAAVGLGYALLCGGILARSDRRALQLAAGAGGSFGMALLFKYIALVMIFPVLAVLIPTCALIRSLRRGTQIFFVVLLATSLPFLAFFVPQLWFKGLGGYADFLRISGSGTSLLSRSDADVLGGIRLVFLRNSSVLIHWVPPLARWLAVAGIAAGSIMAINVLFSGARNRLKDGEDIDRRFEALLFLSFVVGGSAVMAWWTLLGVTGWLRHALVGLLAIMTALALTPFMGVRSTRVVSAVLVFGIIGILAVTYHSRTADVPPGFPFPSRDAANVRVYTSIGFSVDPRVHFQKEAVKIIQELMSSDRKAVLFACSWWADRDLEYLLPKALNFHDCLRQKPAAFDGREKAVLVANLDFWNWDANPKIEKFFASCMANQVILSNKNYAVAVCPDDPSIWP
jgi:hypothetical protein